MQIARNKSSRRTRVYELISQAAAKFTRFGRDFLSSLLVRGEHLFLMFKRTQVGCIALVINERHRNGRPQQL